MVINGSLVLGEKLLFNEWFMSGIRSKYNIYKLKID